MQQEHFSKQIPNRQVNNTLQTSDGAIDMDEMHGQARLTSISGVTMINPNAPESITIRRVNSINTLDRFVACDGCLCLLSHYGGRSKQCTCSIQQVGDDFEAVALVYEELLPLSAVVHLLSVLGHQRVEESIVLLSSNSPCTPNGPSNTAQATQTSTAQKVLYA